MPTALLMLGQSQFNWNFGITEVLLAIVCALVTAVVYRINDFRRILNHLAREEARAITTAISQARTTLWNDYLDYTNFHVGEALIGEGNEIAHIDLFIGKKGSPVAIAFANALVSQTEGHTNLLAVLTVNLATKPSGMIATKVTIKGMRQATQMFGPAQTAVAKAIADAVEGRIIPKDKAEEYVIVIGVFIHPAAGTFPEIEKRINQAKSDVAEKEKAAEGKAEDSSEGRAAADARSALAAAEQELEKAKAESNSKIYGYNYEATKEAIARAVKGVPTVQQMLANKDSAKHPYKGFDDTPAGENASAKTD